MIKFILLLINIIKNTNSNIKTKSKTLLL